MATVIGTAVDRRRTERELEGSTTRLRMAQEAARIMSEHGIRELDFSGMVQRALDVLGHEGRQHRVVAQPVVEQEQAPAPRRKRRLRITGGHIDLSEAIVLPGLRERSEDLRSIVADRLAREGLRVCGRPIGIAARNAAA